MKNVKWLAAVLLLAILGSLCLVSCGSGEMKSVTANVKVSNPFAEDDDEKEILDTAVLIESTNPTVLQAITKACQDADIRIENNGNDVTSIAGIEEYDDDDYLYFWDCTIDKKGIDGKAANAQLEPKEDGKDYNIVYTFSRVKKMVTDEDGNEVTEGEEDED